jgi:hypothetical protein
MAPAFGADQQRARERQLVEDAGHLSDTPPDDHDSSSDPAAVVTVAHRAPRLPALSFSIISGSSLSARGS